VTTLGTLVSGNKGCGVTYTRHHMTHHRLHFLGKRHSTK